MRGHHKMSKKIVARLLTLILMCSSALVAQQDS